jgi:hypothetical protein
MAQQTRASNTEKQRGSKNGNKDTPGVPHLLSDPKESLVDQRKVEVHKSHVLVRVVITTRIENVSGSMIPDRNWEITMPGQKIHRRREYSYGPGQPGQKVMVIEQETVVSGGKTEQRPRQVTYVDQPSSLDF